MTTHTDVHPVPASSIGSRDHEADVVIAGYGVSLGDDSFYGRRAGRAAAKG